MAYRRNTTDVAHKIVAVGSRSVESAQKFISDYAPNEEGIKAYSTYAEVYADPVSDVLHDDLCVHRS